jgi:iron complex outermembrane receptor protein
MYRMRGLSSLQSNAPLFVVDGMILITPELMDPYDIESIRVLRDVSATSEYGFLGSAGVIEITTKGTDFPLSDSHSQKFSVEYNGYLALSGKSGEIPVMNREQYLAAGGIDLGSDTDWQDQVSRRAFTYVNHISISGGNENTSYRLSGNLRQAEGILLRSGFEQMNGRARIAHRLLDDRLELKLSLASTTRESDYSFVEGFRYAVVFNPTSPARFDNGNYYQPILFDNFNPLAVLDLNTHDGKSNLLSFYTQASFELTDQLGISANFGRQFSSASFGEFYPDNSFFRGLNRGGLARRTFTDNNFTLFEARGTYVDDISEHVQLRAAAGYSFKEFFSENLIMELGNLPTNDQGYYAIDLSADRVLGGLNNVYLESDASPNERIIGYFGQLSLKVSDRVFADASLRREGSTKLGSNHKWGLFPAASLSVDFTRIWESNTFSQLTGSVGYGKTGTLPDESGLAVELYEYSFLNGGIVSLEQEANPDLKWENKREVNLGLDYGLMNNRLTGRFNLYQINISDFILETAEPPNFVLQYQNAGEIRSRGWEISLNYDFFRNTDFEWQSGLIMSGYNSVLIDYINDEGLLSNPGAPGQGSATLVRYAVGEELGQLWGPVFSGQVDESGGPIFVDVNNDGQLVVDFGSALDDDSDFVKLGNAIPDLELGWVNRVHYKNWRVDLLIRGAFGHSLANLNRMFYEPVDAGAIGVYNRVLTDKAVDGLSFSTFSSLYVEKADFVKLDYLTISRRFYLNSLESISDVTAYITVENVFTLTGYTGSSPEPILQDSGPIDNGGRFRGNVNRLVMGVDRRMNYLPARSLIFGLNLKF